MSIKVIQVKALEDKNDLISRYLADIKAKRRSKSFEEYELKMRCERRIKQIFTELQNEKIIYNEVLPKSDYFIEPDFNIQRGDITIAVILKSKGEQDPYIVTKDEIFSYKQILSKLNYMYLIVAWMILPNFPSMSLDLSYIEEALTKNQFPIISDDLIDFKEEILNLVHHEAPTLLSISPQTSREIVSENMLMALKEICNKTFKMELKSKRPRLVYKKRALRSISNMDVDKICHYIEKVFEGELSDSDFIDNIKLLNESEVGEQPDDNRS